MTDKEKKERYSWQMDGDVPVYRNMKGQGLFTGLWKVLFKGTRWVCLISIVTLSSAARAVPLSCVVQTCA